MIVIVEKPEGEIPEESSLKTGKEEKERLLEKFSTTSYLQLCLAELGGHQVILKKDDSYDRSN